MIELIVIELIVIELIVIELIVIELIVRRRPFASFVSFATDCKPVLAVRGAGGSAGFLDCDAAGDAAFVFADATSLLLGDEFELADFAGEFAAVSPIGCEPSFDGD